MMDVEQRHAAEPDDRPEAAAPERANEAPAHDILDVTDRGETNKPGQAGEGASKPDRTKEEDRPAPPSKSVFLIVGVVLLLALAWGAYSHWSSYSQSGQTTDESANRVVDVRTTQAKRLDTPIPLTLPGQTDAYDTASILARATGYISQRRVDIGSRVKKGDLLVYIAAPDLDQQLLQAEAQIGQTRAALVQAQATVDQAQANLNLAKVNLSRASTLTQQGYGTVQNRDTQQANTESQQANLEAANAGVKVADANVQAQQATIDRLKALAAFEDVRAPFDGVITSRSVDTGDLIDANSTTASPMFTIARDDIIRIMVRIPQNEAVGVRDGLGATMVVPQMPNRQFKGTVTRSSNVLLYSSRTLTTEVDVPNPTGELRAGLYVMVTLQVPRAEPEVNVPAEALIFNQGGLQVATVEDGKIKLHQVDVDRDHGTDVDLRNGLKGGERIVVNPPATLKDGSKVNEKREEDQKKPDAQQGDQKPQGGQAAAQPTGDDSKSDKPKP